MLSPTPTSGRSSRSEASSTMSTSTSLSISERNNRDSMLLAGSVFLITSDGKTLNLPVPSQSPRDPLNWSNWKRGMALLCLGVFSVTSLVLTQGASLLFKGFQKSFPNETASAIITFPTLMMGIGALIWVPLSLAFGRRIPFLMASLLLLLATIGAALSTTFYQVLGSVCLIGIAEGFALTAAFLIIVDVSFIDERPKFIAAVWSLVGFVTLVLLGTIPFTTRHGMEWQRFYQLWIIPSGVTCLMSFFFFPETLFKRPTVAYDGLTILQTASEKITIYETDGTSLAWEAYNKTLPKTPDNNWFQSVSDRVCLRFKGASWKSLILCYPQILFCLVNPLLFAVVILNAVNFAGMIFIGSTYSLILTFPPYNLPSSLVIHVNTSAAIGSLLAWPLGGTLLGYVLKTMARRNKGVREAEHYLIGYILPVLTGALSSLVYGLAVHHHLHFTVYYVAYGLNGFSFVAMSIANTLWITEAFPRWAAPAVAAVAAGSYISSFAISFALVHWIKAQGYLFVGIELMILQLVIQVVFVPIAFWGKGLRQKIHGRYAERRDGALRPL